MRRQGDDTESMPVQLSVPPEYGDQPLRACVAVAMQRYFADLDGATVDQLYQMVLNEVEQPLLAAVMEHTGGNQTRASQLLGLNRGTLRKKLKAHGLD
ncbi:MAG: DNA-binding transcriptional regulator Fis [Gammaproteobacteria bacterium]